MKAASCEERLQSTSSNNRDKRSTLKESADGKLSLNDISHLYGLSRQRVEGFVSEGQAILSTMDPMLVEINVTGEACGGEPKKRIGNPSLFTYTSPTAHPDPETGEVTRVCICCEDLIDPDDPEMVIAIIDRDEVAWCSRECARDLTIDAYMVSNRYKRHWSSVALAKDPVDERSRVREITPQRMEALREHAISCGYV